MKSQEKRILSDAVASFEQVTEMRLALFVTQESIELELRDYEHPILFSAIVVPILSKTKLSILQKRLHQLDNIPILITRFISKELAILLKELGINYIDTAANTFIKAPPLFIYIKGNRLNSNSIKNIKEKKAIFKKASLQLIFALLCNQGLERNPYREIADIASIGLGTVQLYMDKLKHDGFLIRNKKNEIELINKEKLFHLWVEDYPQQIKAKNVIGRYEIKNQTINIEETIAKYGALLGGETAAAKITNYLRPFVHTIYIGEKVGEFILRNRLIKRQNGNIELMKKFWNFDDDNSENNLVPNILIYADLISTNDQRNIETANIIYDQEIARYLR